MKQEFIAKNNLVLWRLFDNWSARKVDSQMSGMAKALGWQSPQNGAVFNVPATTLLKLAVIVRDRLQAKGLRVIGNPETKVSRVALTHGFLLVPELQKVLKEPGLDAVIVGEPVEWEAGPYFHDLVASGQKKGMIVVGHEASEEPGSAEMAAWLKTFISEVPVEFIPAGEPFWVPRKA
jgi:putative NIF3 family GTP cyclohydrolase 1 type 2